MRIQLSAARPPANAKGRPVTNVISTAKLRAAIDSIWNQVLPSYRSNFETGTRSTNWTASERIPLDQILLPQVRDTSSYADQFITVSFFLGGSSATLNASNKVIVSGSAVVIKLVYRLPSTKETAAALLDQLTDEYDGSLSAATDPTVLGDLVTRTNRALFDERGVYSDIKSLYELEFKWSQLRALRDRTGPLADSAERELWQLEERLNTVLNSEAQHLYNALVFWLNDYDWQYSLDPAESPLIFAGVVHILSGTPASAYRVQLNTTIDRLFRALGYDDAQTNSAVTRAAGALSRGGEPFDTYDAKEYSQDVGGLRTATLKLRKVLIELGLADAYDKAYALLRENSYVRTYENAEKVVEGLKPSVFAKLSTSQKIIAYHKALTTAHNNGGMSEIAFSSDFDARNFSAPQKLTDLSNMAPPPEWQAPIDHLSRMPRGGALRVRLADVHLRGIAVPLADSPADVARIEPAEEPKPTDERQIPVVHNVDKESDVGVSNILNVVKSMRGPELEYWTKWYDFAHSIGEELALAYRLPLNVVAGVIAVLSPGSKWHTNIDSARSVLDWWSDRERAGSPWGDRTRSGIGRFRLAEARQAQRKRPTEYYFDFKDKDRRTKKPIFPPVARIENPLSFNAPMGAYGPSVAGYGSNIKKALDILDAYVSGDKNPAPKFIDEESSPKVWVFYNSIVNPSFAADDLVLDGHAINIWRGEKVSLKGLSSPGANERAQMLADYTKAAKILGMSVQGLQAATWWAWKYGTPITQA